MHLFRMRRTVAIPQLLLPLMGSEGIFGWLGGLWRLACAITAPGSSLREGGSSERDVLGKQRHPRQASEDSPSLKDAVSLLFFLCNDHPLIKGPIF